MFRADELARRSGRTQSQEAERLIETALRFDQLLETMRAEIRELRSSKKLEAALHSEGHIPLRTKHGTIWFPPGHPDAPPSSGFISPEKE
jgi:hypothetical protein